jgi:nitrogen fixation protein FixH
LIFRLLVVALMLGPAAAWGQATGHSHQGGQEVRVGKYEVELVVKGADVTAYVLDDKEKKVDASGLTGSLVVLARGNQQKTVELRPGGDNKLAGRIDFPIDGKFRATLTLRTPSGDAGKGRYNMDIPR